LPLIFRLILIIIAVMNKYELTFLLPEEAEAETIKTLIESLQGKISEEQKWGKRLLAYPIDKQMNGYYCTWFIEMEAKAMAELKKKLSFNEKLLRYLLLKVE